MTPADKTHSEPDQKEPDHVNLTLWVLAIGIGLGLILATLSAISHMH
jgi:hypothetical protein